jgi:hypothetical protein
VFGPQAEVDPDHADIGNGVGPSGAPIPPSDPRRTSVAEPPEAIGRYVAAIRASQPIRAGHYILDNEPGLWNSTHRDVHPEPLTYDELVDRTIAYATAIRAADPDARIAGPAEWGWPAYFYSAKDLAAGVALRPDRRAHGDEPLLAYYLRKLHEHAEQSGVRMLDFLDVHFYPQAKGVFANGGRGATDAATSALRIRSTRSLWDPTYVDESWVADTMFVLPRLRALIDERYPGLGLSIGEWNFGAEEHMSGGLAVAEVLGRFAEHEVHSAFYWTVPKERSPAYWGFRAYTNFDGQGGHFLDRFVPSEAAPMTSLFVSENADRSRLVAIVLNLDPNVERSATLDVSSCGSIRSVRALRYAGGADGFVAVTPAPSQGQGAIPLSLPGYTITILDVERTR